jgi:hypothetical protein
MTRRLMVAVLLLVVGVRAGSARDAKNNGKATELVVVKYQRFIASGALLTPQGWARAAQLFDQSLPYPQNGEIILASTGGALGEMWVKGDHAEVETKWTDYFGTIDSTLRYIRPPDPRVVMTTYQFQLVLTNKHREIGLHGETLKEVTGPVEWKIQGPLKLRYSTVGRALVYLARMRDQSSSPAIKKNAEKTIRILKRLNYGCGSSAC